MSLSEWSRLHTEALDDPTNFPLWSQLIDCIEDVVTRDKPAVAASHELQQRLHTDFNTLLSTWPHLETFWTRYVTVEYTLNGLDKSRDILKRAAAQFPQSLTLWVDYVSVVVQNRLAGEAEIRALYESGASCVGRQYMSHPFWDSYLKWEAETSGAHSNELLNLYLRIIEIPLYEYARYFEAFSALREFYGQKELLPKEEGTLEDAEIKAHFDNVFQSTQTQVNKCWSFESKLQRESFKPTEVPDLDVWNNYLAYGESLSSIPQTNSLFERCLITTCSYESVWVRYLRYLISHNQNPLPVFERAFRFVDKRFRDVRYLLCEWFETTKKDLDAAQRQYLELVEQYPAEYDPITHIFAFYLRRYPKEEVIMDSLAIVSKHTPKLDALKHLQRIASPKTVPQLAVEVAKVRWLTDYDVKSTRKILSSYTKHPSFQGCYPYWHLYFKFESCCRNRKSLTSIANHLKSNSQMSIEATNRLLLLYKDFLFRNSTPNQLENTADDTIKIFLETDTESSTCLKSHLKRRLDPEHPESVNKRLVRENGHPGGVKDARPTIVNPVEWDLPLHVASLPQFRNVEKANVQVKWRSE